jgi:peptidyl-prolyl cis-trans isomerase C
MSQPFRFLALGRLRALPAAAVLSAAVFSVVCATTAGAAEPTPAPVARVNGQAVPAHYVDELAKLRSTDPRTQDQPRQKLIDDLVMAELLSQKARAEGLDRRPDLQAEIELQYKQMLAQRYLQRLAAEVKLDEAELRQRYEQEPIEHEIETRHILVGDEATARKLIALLGKGKSFAALAREYSQDDGSKNQGGSIGRQVSSELAPGYAQAAVALRPGRYTREPVQTDFGWHVIWLDKKKTLIKPPFEAVREGLRQSLVNEQVQARVHALRDAAQVEQLAAP